MTVGDRAKSVLRWIAARRPREILIAGWVVFVLGCYPGYLSVDSTLQLYTVRSGDFTDYAPVMTALWSLLEYVTAGPFPMLALQSGAFLFGLYAILRRILSPRAAAVTAAAVLLFPPVFAPMAVIWPDPLMAGALIGGTGALLQPRRGWKIAGCFMYLVACSCRPEAVFAIVPLVVLAIPPGLWWRRAAIAVGLTVAVSLGARVADRVLTVHDTYMWQQQLMVMDTVGTLRRAKLKKVEVFDAAFAGLPVIVDPPTLKQRVTASTDALNWWPLSNGDKRIFDPIGTDDEAAALSHDWRAVTSGHRGAYYRHRKAMSKALLGFNSKWEPVFDSLGDFDLLAPMHHRATTSDWEDGMRAIVRGFAATPLFRPWLYLLLAIGAIVVARKQAIPRAFAISALAWELSMFVLAPGTDYRYSHWMVTATCIAVAAYAVARKSSWAATQGRDG